MSLFSKKSSQRELTHWWRDFILRWNQAPESVHPNGQIWPNCVEYQRLVYISFFCDNSTAMYIFTRKVSSMAIYTAVYFHGVMKFPNMNVIVNYHTLTIHNWSGYYYISLHSNLQFYNMHSALHEVNCWTRYFVLEKYAYFWFLTEKYLGQYIHRLNNQMSSHQFVDPQQYQILPFVAQCNQTSLCSQI